MSGDLGDNQDLLKIAGEIKVHKPGSQGKMLQSQGGNLATTMMPQRGAASHTADLTVE